MTAEDMLDDLHAAGWKVSLIPVLGVYVASARKGTLVQPDPFARQAETPSAAIRETWEAVQQATDVFSCDSCGHVEDDPAHLGNLDGAQLCGRCIVNELNERYEKSHEE